MIVPKVYFGMPECHGELFSNRQPIMNSFSTCHIKYSCALYSCRKCPCTHVWSKQWCENEKWKWNVKWKFTLFSKCMSMILWWMIHSYIVFHMLDFSNYLVCLNPAPAYNYLQACIQICQPIFFLLFLFLIICFTWIYILIWKKNTVSVSVSSQLLQDQ